MTRSKPRSSLTLSLLFSRGRCHVSVKFLFVIHSADTTGVRVSPDLRTTLSKYFGATTPSRPLVSTTWFDDVKIGIPSGHGKKRDEKSGGSQQIARTFEPVSKMGETYLIGGPARRGR